MQPQVPDAQLDWVFDAPLTAAPDTSLAEILKLMGHDGQMSCQIGDQVGSQADDQLAAEEKIEPFIGTSATSCVLVLDESSMLIGILTEQDIVRQISQQQTLTGLTVADIMSKRVVTLPVDACSNILLALNTMSAYQIRHLPVTDSNGQVLGLMSASRLSYLLEAADFMKVRQVREVMESRVVCALPTDSMLQVAELMARQQVSYVLIAQDQPIGIITARDVVQFQRLGLDIDRTQAETIMSFPLFAVSPLDPLKTVAQKIQQHWVQQLVVVSQQGHLLGTVSQDRLLLAIAPDAAKWINTLQSQAGQSQAGQSQAGQSRSIQTDIEPDEMTSDQEAVTDTSDRNDNEISLQQSEAILRSFFNSTPMMMGVVAIAHEDIVHISDNPVTASFFGLPPAEMRNRRASEMGVPEKLIRLWIKHYRAAARTGKPVHFEYLHELENKRRWLSATVASIDPSKADNPVENSEKEHPSHHRENSGQLRFAYVVEDITERKQTEAKLQEQAALLNVATDAILVRDKAGCIIFWNKGAENLYGWSVEEALGKYADELLYLDELHRDEEIHLALTTKGSWQGERHQVTKSGQNITVMSRWTLVKDEQGNANSILTVNTDITQAKQLERQFLRAQRLESIGTLASGIAHDLNNILTPIYGVAHLLPLQLPEADERIQQQFKILQDSAKRGSEIIRQVLSFARGMESDALEERLDRRVPVAIRHVISEIKSFTHKTFPKSIEVSVNIPPDLRLVMGDVTQLHQVFMNFFVNARDAMPEGGQLTLSATNLEIDEAFAQAHLDAKTGPYILVTVADTGTGISLEQLDRIFEPFFTTKQTQGGTGLGLSTAHGIVKSHGGFIAVYSEVGKGTQFNIYLPAVDRESVAVAEPAEYPRGLGECVLLVDDEAPIREVTRRLLENYGYQVLVAEDGVEAIAQYALNCAEKEVTQTSLSDADSDGIQVVLIDMTMPNLGGAKTIQVLQKINPQLKVIMVSGLPGNQQIAATISDSVKAFLQKPYSSATLLKTMRQVIEPEGASASLRS